MGHIGENLAFRSPKTAKITCRDTLRSERFRPWTAYFLSDLAQIFFVSSGEHTGSADTHESIF